MFVSTYRITKFAFQNFWRNFWLSVITITMLVMTLITVNILLVLNYVTDQAIRSVEDRIEVSVYFQQETKQETVDSAVSYLRGLSQVRDVVTISSEDALKRFIEQHKDSPVVLDSLNELGGNPFGATLIVKAKEAQDFNQILDALENPQFRDSIREKDFSNYTQIIERIQGTTERIRFFGFVIMGVFLAIAILIVFNTVRIGIFIHREEIGIMRLVGASNWFIKAPFLLEMILLSLIAVGLTAIIVYPAVAFIEPQLSVYFGAESAGLVDYFAQNGLMIFGGQFLALILVTLFSTGLAMRKYLKV